MLKPILAALLVTIVAFANPGSAHAQDRHVTLLGIPSATVAPSGLAFGALALSTRRLGATGQDGSGAFGLGFGSAEDSIGVQATAFITSLTNDFGDSGYFELKAARQVSTGDAPTYVALTLGGLAGWGDSKNRPESISLAVTTFRQLQFGNSGEPYPVVFTLGAGSHVRDNETKAGLYAGAGIGLTPNLGLSASWSGDYVNLGAGFKIAAFDNLSLSATVYDAFDTKDSRRLTVAATYVFRDLF